MSGLDSTWVAVGGYLAVALVSLALGVVERRRTSSRSVDLWPRFWFFTAALFLVMAIGRAGDAGDLVADLGRRQARAEGWYATRRSLQASVIGLIAAVWAVAVVTAIWRVPERRRRYLPTALLTFSLLCFVGVRLISLHQIDAVLHDYELGGVSIGGAVEVGALTLILAAEVWRFDFHRGTRMNGTERRRASPRMTNHRPQPNKRSVA